MLGDGLEFKPMAVTAQDAQMLELARATAEWVCSVFHVPLYKIGAAPTPSLANVQALNLEYYAQAVQKLLEDIEACLITRARDEGRHQGRVLHSTACCAWTPSRRSHPSRMPSAPA